MKALFLSQSNSIDFFYEFQKNSKIFDEVAYVATDKEYYKKFLNKHQILKVKTKIFLKIGS